MMYNIKVEYTAVAMPLITEQVSSGLLPEKSKSIYLKAYEALTTKRTSYLFQRVF